MVETQLIYTINEFRYCKRQRECKNGKKLIDNFLTTFSKEQMNYYLLLRKVVRYF